MSLIKIPFGYRHCMQNIVMEPIFNRSPHPMVRLGYGRGKTRNIVLASLCWNVNKGDILNIWCDPWVPNLPDYVPKFKKWVLVDRSINRVIDLIDASTNSWKVALVRDLFEPQSTAAI